MAIREAAGPSIQREFEALAPIEAGQAVMTGAGELTARHLIHAAIQGPGIDALEQTLRLAVRACLELAEGKGIASIAFPALGAGKDGLSLQRSAEIMLEEARNESPRGGSLGEIRFVVSGEPAYRVFEQVLDAERIRKQLERLGQ